MFSDDVQMDQQEEMKYLQELFGLGLDNTTDLLNPGSPQFDLGNLCAMPPTSDDNGTKRKRPRPDFSANAPELDNSMPSISHPGTPYSPITNINNNPLYGVKHSFPLNVINLDIFQ